MKNTNYSIGIVTYHARFEKYFIPLVKNLARIFPDKEIICIANGHPNETLQITYLRKFINFLKSFRNVKYITYEKNQSLAKCWNQIILHSETDGCLLLNDDTQVSALFRSEFENKIINNDLDFSTINKSWSHFFITKKIIRKIGWFDENLVGIGYEDADYMFRMAEENYVIQNTACLGIKNYVAPATDPTWKEVSAVSDNKYSSANKEYIKTKYFTKNFNPELTKFNNFANLGYGKIEFSLKSNTSIVKKYDDLLLTTEINNAQNNILYKTPKIKVAFEKIVYKVIDIIKTIRRILKR